MAEDTITAVPARDAALSNQAAEQSTTAAGIAQNLVDAHADRLRKDTLIAWFKGLGLEGMQTIHDANQ